MVTTKEPKVKKEKKIKQATLAGAEQPPVQAEGSVNAVPENVQAPINIYFEGKKVVKVEDAEVNGEAVKKLFLEDRSSTIISVEVFNKLTN